MTRYIADAVASLVTRVERVIETRNILTFSNRFYTLAQGYARLAVDLEYAKAREAAALDIAKLRQVKVDQLLTERDALLVRNLEVGAALDELTNDASGQASQLQLELAEVDADRDHCAEGLEEIVAACSAVKVPNGTTRKIKRLALNALFGRP